MRLGQVCMLGCSGTQNKPDRVQTAPRSAILTLKELSFEILAEAEFRIWGLSTLGVTEWSVTSVFVTKPPHSHIGKFTYMKIKQTLYGQNSQPAYLHSASVTRMTAAPDSLNTMADNLKFHCIPEKKSQPRVLYCPARTEKRQNRYTSCWIHFFKNHKGMSNSLHDWLKNFQQPFWVFHQNKTNALIHSFLLCDKSCNRFKIQYNSGSQFFFSKWILVFSWKY